MECLSTFIRSEKVRVSCIYKVTNKLNGKVYIGQTTNFRKRLSDYNNLHKKEDCQPIVRAVKKHGQENFTIEIIEECDPSLLSVRETYYTQLYKSKDRKYGYNYVEKNGPKTNTKESRRNKSLGHIGLKESANTKRKKSNIILIVRKNRLMICDSAKLFGDLVGKSKDYIKNCLRHPSRFQDMNLYYGDYDKRQEIREKMNKKRSIRNTEYMEYLDIIDKIDEEGVETIYRYFDALYSTSYIGYNNEYRIKFISEEDLYYSVFYYEYDDLLYPNEYDDDNINFTYDDFNSFFIDPDTGLLCIYD